MYIIANPQARGGRGEGLARLVSAELDKRGARYSLNFTGGAMEAAALAKKAANSGESLVICIGGDGTLSEVAGGLSGSETALGIIPAGTGDDFARYLGIPKDPIAALDIALSGHIARIDLGAANDHVFINTAGSGIDVEVLRRTMRYKKMFRGLLAYIMGVLSSVAAYRAMELTIDADGVLVEQKAMLVSVANGRYFGGGMCVAPLADASDGLFDVHYVDEIPRWLIPFVLAGFVRGRYIKWSCAHHFRCRELTVTASDSSLQLDGEIFSEKRVHYQILPKMLKIAIGEKTAQDEGAASPEL